MSALGAGPSTTVRGLDNDGPFGDAGVRSNLINSRVSHGLQQAAGNLLTKALRAVTAGDLPRAEGYVRRALQLPVDEHEQVEPGPWAASLLVFDAVADVLEASPEDDPSWLDAAEQAMDAATDDGRDAMLRALHTIACDYHLSRGEAQRIRHLLRAAGLPDERPHELVLPANTVDAVLAVVTVTADYQAALAR